MLELRNVPRRSLNHSNRCTEFSIYYRVVLPIVRLALAALVIIQLIGSWNNLMWAFIKQ